MAQPNNFACPVRAKLFYGASHLIKRPIHVALSKMELYYIYIIENLADLSWYIGFSIDVPRRIDEHNLHIGGEYTGKKQGKWRLIYIEGYASKLDALGREKYLKSGAGRTYIKKQLANYLNKH